MSWGTFKQNILRTLNSPEDIDDIESVANLWATEYDSAIKGGTDTVNKVKIQIGNVELMEKLFLVALRIGGTQNTPLFSLVTQMGQGVLAYWTNATMANTIPLIPAPGSVQNISVIVNQCYVPGIWAPQKPIKPTDNTEIIVNQFIAAATKHLTTISGIAQTISLYPGAPPTPGPGIVSWTGYTVPPSGPSVSSSSTKALNKVKNASSTLLSEVEIAVYTEKLNTAKETLTDLDGAIGASTVEEYIKLKTSELSSGHSVSAEVDLTEEDIQSLVADTPPEFKSVIGNRIVQEAIKDIDITETDNKNYGGFNSNYPGTPSPLVPGRIDLMVNKYIGPNANLNLVKTSKSGAGYAWCAGAVSAWWRQAGALPLSSVATDSTIDTSLISNYGNDSSRRNRTIANFKKPFNGSTSCDAWMDWARQNNRWSRLPVVGAAVLYGNTKDATHIGVVASINPDGSVTTIEGNTLLKSYSRNGGLCAQKQASLNRVVGYVYPPDVVVT